MVHPMIRVLIIDDHPIVRRGVEEGVEREPGFVLCGGLGSIDGFADALARHAPDVVVLDLGVARGRLDPLLLEASLVDVPVLVFTLEEDEAVREATLRAGAAGYVHKAEPVGALMDAVREAAGRRSRPAPAPDAIRGKLTARERHVVAGLVAGQTPKALAFELGVSASTVYTLVERARRKCGVGTTAELIRHAIARDLMD